MTFLVDTNVLSEGVKRSPDPRVLRWLGECGRIGISAVTLDEIHFGLALKPSASVQRVLEMYLDAFCIVHPVTAGIAKHAGTLRGQLAKRGQVRSQSDMLIVATAAAHGLTLATRNTRDFAGCGVALLNPFDS